MSRITTLQYVPNPHCGGLWSKYMYITYPQKRSSSGIYDQLTMTMMMRQQTSQYEINPPNISFELRQTGFMRCLVFPSIVNLFFFTSVLQVLLQYLCRVLGNLCSARFVVVEWTPLFHPNVSKSPRNTIGNVALLFLFSSRFYASTMESNT